MMIHRRLAMSALALAGCVLSVGCAPKMTIEEMKAMMPQRPAELDQLNMFVGEWEFEGIATINGLEEPLQSTGTSEMKWGPNKWYLVGTGVYDMEEFDPMHGHEVWTYDVKAKKYRSSWTDTMGSMGYGTSKYDPETRTWKMKAKSHGAMGKSSMTGTITIIDNDTMEWEMKEKVMLGMVTVMEWKGVSRRK